MEQERMVMKKKKETFSVKFFFFFGAHTELRLWVGVRDLIKLEKTGKTSIMNRQWALIMPSFWHI